MSAFQLDFRKYEGMRTAGGWSWAESFLFWFFARGPARAHTHARTHAHISPPDRTGLKEIKMYTIRKIVTQGDSY